MMKIVQISFLRHSSAQFQFESFLEILKKIVVLLNIEVNVKSKALTTVTSKSKFNKFRQSLYFSDIYFTPRPFFLRLRRSCDQVVLIQPGYKVTDINWQAVQHLNIITVSMKTNFLANLSLHINLILPNFNLSRTDGTFQKLESRNNLYPCANFFFLVRVKSQLVFPGSITNTVRGH